MSKAYDNHQMKTNRLVFIISFILPLVVSVPRVLFLFNENKDEAISSVIQVTVEDILIRFILLLGFSLVTLKFNLIWIERFEKKPRFLISIAINTMILLFWILIFYLINTFLYNIYSSVPSPAVNSISYIFLWVLLLITSKTINLLEKSKLDAIEKEVLKQKSLQNELDTLKNQINPHFLFNSLNTLSLLVKKDQKAAEKFINKLSFLLRNILQSNQHSLMTVREELKVLDSYNHLIKERFQDNFNVTVKVNDEMLDRKIPVLALQILMENAVKHNEISAKNPLYMEFYNEGKYIVGKNVLQKRKGNFESTNTGLKNLNTRTKIQMGEEIEILREENYFTVKIPTQ